MPFGNTTVTCLVLPVQPTAGVQRVRLRLFWPILEAGRTIFVVQHRSVFVLALSFGAIVGSTAGCAHRDPADRSVEQLKSEIAKLQADRDRIDERLEALESADRERDEGKPVARPRTGSPESVPRLPVVRVGESSAAPPEGETADIESAEPRPVVQASGSPGSLAKRGRSSSRADAVAISPEAKRDYDAALGLVRSKQYDRALEALTTFVVRYPDHPYVENAMYWRGECYFAKGDYGKAAEQFEGLSARFPFGNKTPDALLKLGLCQQRLGSQEQAQKTFAELKDRYPKSDAVRQLPRP
jgi:tol-pal system protein YbgF